MYSITGQIGSRRRGAGCVVLGCVLALLTACGGSSGSTEGRSAGQAEAARPEGTGSITSSDADRTPADPKFLKGTASLSQVSYKPVCASGPCDVDVIPAGASGTYTPPGMPIAKASDGAKDKGFRLTWNADKKVYETVRGPETVDCAV